MATPTKPKISPLSQDCDLADSLTLALTSHSTPDPLPDLIADFLADYEQANRSPHTLRAYASDLSQFGRFYSGPLSGISPDVLRGFQETLAALSPTSRARKQATLASFLAWARRHDHLAADPMAKLDRVKRPERLPRGLPRKDVERVLGAIPKDHKRDRLLFRLLHETGIRISEALGVHVEDLDLTQDDEHLTVTGKGDKQRTILLDDPGLVKQLRGYLKATGYKHGLLFRASKNGGSGPMRYQSIQARWAGYCQAAGVEATIHQLRHSHATEMVNGGVSLATVRKRLGHRNLQTTLLYAEASDKTADKELRAWRRRRGKGLVHLLQG